MDPREGRILNIPTYLNQSRASTEQEESDTIYDEVFDSANYDDHYMHIHMKADSSQKVHPTDF